MAIVKDSFIILFRLKAPYQFTMSVYFRYNPDSYWHPFIPVQYGDEVPQVCIHLHQKLHYNYEVIPCGLFQSMRLNCSANLQGSNHLTFTKFRTNSL